MRQALNVQNTLWALIPAVPLCTDLYLHRHRISEVRSRRLLAQAQSEYSEIGDVLSDMLTHGAKPLGSGDNGTIYPLCEQYAVKILSKKWDDIRNTMREILFTKLLEHNDILNMEVLVPNNEEEFRLYGHDCLLKMERAKCDLAAEMKLQRHITDTEILEWIGSILHGLAYLHSLGIAHRDIKPENILLVTDGEGHYLHAKIGDFDFSKVLNIHNDKRKDSDDTICGPINHMAPEIATLWKNVINGGPYNGQYTQGIDTWAVGCIMVELLARNINYELKDSEEDVSWLNSNTMAHEQVISYGRKKISFLESRTLNDEARLECLRRWIAYTSSMPVEKALPLAEKIEQKDINLIDELLTLDPSKRRTADELLEEDGSPMSEIQFDFKLDGETLTLVLKRMEAFIDREIKKTKFESLANEDQRQAAIAKILYRTMRETQKNEDTMFRDEAVLLKDDTMIRELMKSRNSRESEKKSSQHASA